MALYAVTHFRSLDSTTQSDHPVVTNDWRTMLLGQRESEHKDPAIGESTIIAAVKEGILVKEGWRVKRLPDFEHGAILFDEQAKEYVKVSNGRCVLDHTSSEKFAEAHKGHPDCLYAPSEAIALRPSIRPNGEVSVHWTYRGVDAAYLSPVSQTLAEGAARRFEIALNPPKELRKQFAGRV